MKVHWHRKPTWFAQWYRGAPEAHCEQVANRNATRGADDSQGLRNDPGSDRRLRARILRFDIGGRYFLLSL